MFCLTFHWLQIDELNGTLLTQLSKYWQRPFGSHLALRNRNTNFMEQKLITHLVKKVPLF